jgi:hypothetical protein
MKFNKIKYNPFLLFAPFLAIYIVLVLYYKTDILIGDQTRYLTYAGNLLNGFYSPPYPDIDLGNGPGYSIILMPFLALNLPMICITFLNAIMYYFSIILLFKILHKFVPFQYALVISIFWAIYLNLYNYLHLILPQIFSVLLVTLIGWSLVNSFDKKTFSGVKKYLFFTGFLIGFLALTKPIFGYVMLVMLIGCGLLWIINRKVTNYKKGVIILIVAFATVTPYLAYTYHLTGRIFYWSTFGGDNLYWISSPYEGEFGSWALFSDLGSDSTKINDGRFSETKAIYLNHRDDFKEIIKYNGVERDDIYNELAIRNIKNYPKKFLVNCISNVGRMLFNFPYSYKFQTPQTLVRLPYNGIIVVLSLFSLFPTILNWRKIPFSIRFFLFFGLIYFGGSILGSAETRMFTIIVPVLLLWIGLMVYKTIKFTLKFDT